MAREVFLQQMRTVFRSMLLNSNCRSKNGMGKPANMLGYGCARALFGQNWATTVRQLSLKFNDKFTAIAECFEKQFSYLAVQRMRRTAQLFAFYNRLYEEKLLDRLGGTIFRRLQNKPLLALLGAALFSFDENKITDDEMNRCVYDMAHIQELIQRTKGNHPADPSSHWEKIIDKPHLTVWRRPLEANENLFQYKVYGRFDDIPARAFFNTQIDLDFWKQWDKQSLDIRIVDKHEQSGSEVIHWTVKFPYPMYSRDYVYMRRYKVDQQNKIMVLVSQTVAHPTCPVKEDIVRVTEYESALVIHPNKDFDENGFQYVLTYYDDPQTTFPKVCYNWMASTGVPEFVERLHKASQLMNERIQKGYRPAFYQNMNQNNNHAHFSLSQTQQYA